VAGSALRQLIEEDWLKAIVEPLSTRSDAAGACDSVKDGKYGFHTGHEANPWWQVDLGAAKPLTKVVVYNRLDYAPGLHNADNLQLLTSDDGRAWTLRHDNQGRHFGGIRGAKPLEVSFTDSAVRARFVRLRVPSAQPIFFHLDEVEVYGADSGDRNLALHQPADQSSLSQWSTAKVRIRGEYPTAACLARGRRLAADLQAHGLETGAFCARFDELARQLAALPADASDAAKRDLHLQTRWAVRRLVFANPLLNFQRLLLVKRFTQETYPDVCLNHMPWVSRPGGDICILSPPAGGRNLFAALCDPAGAGASEPIATIRYVLNRALGPGHVHGMDLWWDADRVVFGYSRARSDEPPAGWLDRSQSYRLRRTEEPTHIFEVGIDGRNLRQLTAGEWSDLDPTYLPTGDVAFASERCGTSLQCNEYDKDETSCNLYVVRSDGSRIRRLSVNKDGDYLPHCLDNGMIGYTRWEYHERSWAFIQSLWVVRPDGTGADAIFKQHFVNPWALEDVRSIPDSDKLVAIATGHHTLAVGPLVVVNHGLGINEPKGIGIVTPSIKPPEGGMDGVPVPEGGVVDPDGFYSTPWPLSEKYFLVSYTYGAQTTVPNGYGLYVVDVFGNKELVYRDPAISCFLPIPLRPRPRPPVLPDVTDPAAGYATCAVSDASFGCEGLDPKRIRYIRVAEPIGWPYDNQRGGQRFGEDHRYGGPGAERRNLTNWTPIRILGDVPVEPDGSAHFRVPVDTAVYFQLLDENRLELRRMRSFISFQAGEARACVGCHETRAVAPPPRSALNTLALAREPSPPMPPPWGDRPVSFLRDIQPVLDQHCVRCHTGLKPGGGLDFSGGLVSHDRDVAGYGHNRAFETILEKKLVVLAPARAQDASITPPLAYGAHKSPLIESLRKEPHVAEVKLNAEERLRLAMWIDANAPYHDRFVNKRPEQPAYDLAMDQSLQQRLAGVHERRCIACHKPAEVTRVDWIDIRAPQRSLFLTAPLAAMAGGTGKCGRAVYADATDPDYRAVLGLVEEAVARQWSQPRRDIQSLTRPTTPAKVARN
jgi:mono/diheme cytochrome c family protein